MKNKKIILILLALIVVAGVFFVTKQLGNNKSTIDLNLIFDPNKPIIIKDNGKYGYITSKGKTMIEPKYNSATDFYGDYAVVTIDNQETSSYKKTYQVIDKKGNVKVTTTGYYGPEYYAEYGVWVVDGVLYDSKFKKISGEAVNVDYISNGYFEYMDAIKNESGIMNYKAKKIFTMPAAADMSIDISENSYDESELYASIKTYTTPVKQLIISLKNGNVVFTLDNADDYYLYKEDNGIFYYYNKNVTDGYKNKKYIFIKNNKLVYETTETVSEVNVYDYKNQILEIDYGYNYETLGKIQRKYYYDIKNKKMLSEAPAKPSTDVDLDSIMKLYGFKEYYSSGKYGLISNEKVIVPCEYDDIDYLDANLYNYMLSKGKKLVLLEKDKKTILYNLKNSKPITTFDSSYVYDYDSTFLKVTLYENNSYSVTGYMIYNLLTGKSMTFGKDDNIEIGSNYVTIKKDGKKTYYNTDFKQIYVATES